MSSYLLDSDVCIDFIRQKNRRVVERITSLPMLNCLLSAVGVGELWLGVFKAKFPAHAQSKLDPFLERFSVLSVDERVAIQYAEIRASLEKVGVTVGHNDLFIAATAMAYDLTLLTRNDRDYKRIPGLKYELVA